MVRMLAALLCATGYLSMTCAAPARAAEPDPTATEASHLDQLLRPSGVDRVTLSPSGTRVALLIKGRDSDSDLMVLERRGNEIQTLLGTHLGPKQAIGSFTWLSDNFLAVYFASPDAQFAQFAIANIDRHSLEPQDPLTVIVKTSWGDADHLLLSETGGNCRNTTGGRCLVSFDLPGGTSTRISDALRVTTTFFAVSPTEIYAVARDGHGMPHEFRLESVSGRWEEIGRGTVAQRRSELQAQARNENEQPIPQPLMQRVTQAGMPGARPVWTEPDHKLVGLIGRAPQRAFVALDSRLDGLQALLEQQFPDERVQISGLNPALTQGMVQVQGPDRPPVYLFFTDSGSLTEYAQLEPTLNPAMLGRTHIERSWADGMPVSVTLPPAGVTPIGVLVQPLAAPLAGAEDPLERYDGLSQAFAQAGITVVRALASMPGSFPSTAAGGEWRQAEAARFQQVLSHVRTDLAAGKPICLYGAGDDGALALAWSGLAPVDCTVAIGARVDPQAVSRPIQLVGLRNIVTVNPSAELLHRELPALYGLPGSDQLADPVQWVPQLPSRVMLGYDMLPRVQQEYASESAALRAAIRRAGKNLTYYADDSVQPDDIQSRDRLLGAVVDYVRQSLTNGAAAPTTAAR